MNSREYKFQNKKYFVISEDKKEFIEIGDINIIKDTLFLKVKTQQIRYYRVMDKNTLKEFVQGDIDKEKYHNSINKRLSD